MVTIDCVDPQALAKFWTEAAGYSVASDWGEFVVLVPSSGGLRLGLQRVPEARAGKNRVHVDWEAPDRAAEVQCLVGLGAEIVGEHHVPGLSWTVLADPEGNEFCVAGSGSGSGSVVGSGAGSGSVLGSAGSSAPPASEAGSVG
jgi:predicted enzyme related to lactoylglutathione lyase